jgi:AraC-like DNA-binding protein
LALPPFPACLMLHVLVSGSCWIEVEGAQRRQLQPGDLALVPHGEGHRLVSEPGTPAVKLFDLPRAQVGDRFELLQQGGGGAATNLICGVVRFDHPAAQHLLTLLPRLIRVDAWSGPEMEWIQSTMRFMATEARQIRPGGETVITRLADILVIQAIRSWIAQDPAGQTGWLGALRDQQIGRAITLIHRGPAQAWTVASLAAEVAMSRSAFAARFTELVGEPAMHYVTRWRMHVALTWLKEEDAPLGELAGRLGYQSEAAFSRAFKRFVGVSPGAARRNGAATNQSSIAW